MDYGLKMLFAARTWTSIIYFGISYCVYKNTPFNHLIGFLHMVQLKGSYATSKTKWDDFQRKGGWVPQSMSNRALNNL